MKTKYIFKIIQFSLVSVFLSFFLIGCDDSETNEPPTGGSPYLHIEKVEPPRIGFSGGEFKVYCAAGFDDGNRDVTLRIKQLGTDTGQALIHVASYGNNNDTVTYNLNTSMFIPPYNNPNREYAIFVTAVHDTDLTLNDWASFIWGDPNITLKNIYIEPMFSNPFISSSFNTILQGASNSFGINEILINLNYSTIHYYNLDTILVANTDSALISQLDEFSISTRIENTTSYPYHALGIDGQSRDLTIIGASMNTDYTALCQGCQNWSYIFKSNIDINFPTNLGYVQQSVYNYTLTHELLHQLGNCFGNHEHETHTGQYKNSCALNSPDIFRPSEFKTNTLTYKVCDRHIGILRSHTNMAPFVDDNFKDSKIGTGNLGGQKNVNDYTIVMNLPKSVYKVYEPVLAEFCITNKSSDSLYIYNLFKSNLDETDIIIRDETGKVYSGNKIIAEFITSNNIPTYVIMPNDSLKISMPINNWGQPHIKNAIRDNDWYFSQFAFFPAGHRYWARLNIKESNPEFKGTSFESNEVEFEVRSLDEEDNDLLQLAKSGANNLALSKYPNNTFSEHIKAFLLTNYWSYMLNENVNTTNIILDFEEFFELYPNSSYLLDLKFIAPYFMKLCGRDPENLDEIISNIKNKLKVNSIYKSISSNSMEDGIKRLINNYIKFKK